jgi:hypothetical protein
MPLSKKKRREAQDQDEHHYQLGLRYISPTLAAYVGEW